MRASVTSLPLLFTVTDLCANETQPCHNGGTCESQNALNRYYCLCPTIDDRQYVGLHCETGELSLTTCTLHFCLCHSCIECNLTIDRLICQSNWKQLRKALYFWMTITFRSAQVIGSQVDQLLLTELQCSYVCAVSYRASTYSVCMALRQC